MHSLMDIARSQPSFIPLEEDGQALYVQGLVALRNGETEEAISLLTRALRRQPEHRDMRRNLVRALLVAERYEQVVIHANAALVGAPNDPELHFARGTALNALGQHTKACAAFARTLALRPDHAASWLNMGNASADLDDIVVAETLYRTAIRVDPALAEAHGSLGYLLTVQGRLPEAVEACETAIRLRPDFAQAHWNLAIALLLSGELPRGFAEYEWRKRHTRYRADFPDLAGPSWDGTDPAGRTILVRMEQGFGDAIQFARYLPLIGAAGGRAMLACAPELVPLIRSSGLETVAEDDRVPEHDAWIDQASLPHVFGSTLETIPAAEGYLRAEPDRVQAWRDRLPPERKVGVCLQRQSWPCDRPAPFDPAGDDRRAASAFRLAIREPALWRGGTGASVTGPDALDD